MTIICILAMEKIPLYETPFMAILHHVDKFARSCTNTIRYYSLMAGNGTRRNRAETCCGANT